MQTDVNVYVFTAMMEFAELAEISGPDRAEQPILIPGDYNPMKGSRTATTTGGDARSLFDYADRDMYTDCWEIGFKQRMRNNVALCAIIRNAREEEESVAPGENNELTIGPAIVA
jgi:hypothetical protein